MIAAHHVQDIHLRDVMEYFVTLNAIPTSHIWQYTLLHVHFTPRLSSLRAWVEG